MVGNMFVGALVTLVADAALLEMIDTWAMIVGGEDWELAGPVGLGVVQQEATGRVSGQAVRIGCDGGGWSGRAVRRRAGFGHGQCSVRCSCAAWRVSGSGAGCFGVTLGHLLLFVVWFGSLIVAYSKMFEVVLPFPDQLSHIFHDVGDVMGWNGCVAGCSCYCWMGFGRRHEIVGGRCGAHAGGCVQATGVGSHRH